MTIICPHCGYIVNSFMCRQEVEREAARAVPPKPTDNAVNAARDALWSKDYYPHPKAIRKALQAAYAADGVRAVPPDEEAPRQAYEPYHCPCESCQKRRAAT